MNSQLLQGALDLLILETLSSGPSYGYEIAQTVFSKSNGYFDLKEGSLYPALHRMEGSKYLKPKWVEVDGRRRKYYELTAAGKKALVERTSEWRAFARGVSGVLEGVKQLGAWVR
jgi:PadR family transcriptional regulator, regulatory protein PadR